MSYRDFTREQLLEALEQEKRNVEYQNQCWQVKVKSLQQKLRCPWRRNMGVLAVATTAAFALLSLLLFFATRGEGGSYESYISPTAWAACVGSSLFLGTFIAVVGWKKY